MTELTVCLAGAVSDRSEATGHAKMYLLLSRARTLPSVGKLALPYCYAYLVISV